MIDSMIEPRRLTFDECELPPNDHSRKSLADKTWAIHRGNRYWRLAPNGKLLFYGVEEDGRWSAIFVHADAAQYMSIADFIKKPPVVMDGLTMIDRVARAAYEHMLAGVKRMYPTEREFPDDRWEGITPELQQHWCDIARAAIAAMREMTPEMLMAAGKVAVEQSDGMEPGEKVKSIDFAPCWHAAIDAALKE